MAAKKSWARGQPRGGDTRRRWSEQVGQVFNTMPRDGNSEDTVWLPRKNLQERLAALLSFPGVHICVDGPTGTGKSSLVFTQLSDSRHKYVLVQVTESMRWQDFCRQLVSTPRMSNKTFTADLDIGVEQGLPTGKLRVSLGSSLDEKAKQELFEKIAASWQEHDVCQMMYKEKATLFIDDFERANDEIVKRISDMSKLLTESFVHRNAKLVIVGTGDIYRRVYEANPSLEARLEELSVGTLPTPAESWKFLQMGFEKLGLRHPAAEVKIGKFKSVTWDDNLASMRAVYEAADGLPKSLNELGRDISLRGFGRSRVSPKDIIEESQKMPNKAISRFRRKHHQIMAMVERDAAIRVVLKHLYESGIGQIHSWTDMLDILSESINEEQVNKAIEELISENFLVQTGLSGDVLFVSDLRLAHTLGVVIENPEKYGQKPEKYAPMGQLTLPFKAK